MQDGSIVSLHQSEILRLQFVQQIEFSSSPLPGSGTPVSISSLLQRPDFPGHYFQVCVLGFFWYSLILINPIGTTKQHFLLHAEHSPVRASGTLQAFRASQHFTLVWPKLRILNVVCDHVTNRLRHYIL